MNEPRRRVRIPRWIAAALLLPGVALMIVMVFFVARSEIAHDESRCPFEELDTRRVGDEVSVREDRRQCQEGLEERRWVLLRRGAEPRELGRRRLHAQLFGEGYAWTASLDEGRAQVTVHNAGLPDADLREPPEGDGGAASP